VVDKALIGLPAPCLAVDRRLGFAVVPDPEGKTQVLLAPTRRVAGIESPELLAPGSPNYWAYAWAARTYVEQRAHRSIPRDKVALAVNSVSGRTQRQLHIHVDCVAPSVRTALLARQATMTGEWTRFPVKLMGNHYKVMRLDGDELGTRDPFKLLAKGDDAARAGMGSWTLVVVGAMFGGTPGFVLLASRGGVPDNPQGAGEDLLDHTCAVLRSP
jgi:CDP-diacylglycerol pyrophosphatase